VNSSPGVGCLQYITDFDTAFQFFAPQRGQGILFSIWIRVRVFRLFLIQIPYIFLYLAMVGSEIPNNHFISAFDKLGATISGVMFFMLHPLINSNDTNTGKSLKGR